jgi:hypothetical protein
MNTYDVGDEVRCAAAFANSSGTPLDPTAVFCKVRSPSGTVTLYTYGVDAALVRASAGSYYVDVDASQPGKWDYRFWATGTGKTAGESSFYVQFSRF